MARKALAVLLAAALFCLGGCGPEKGGESPEEPAISLTVTHCLVETQSPPKPSGETPYAGFSYDTVSLDSASAERFPALAAALEEQNASLEAMAEPLLAELVYATMEGLENGRTGFSCAESRLLRVNRADRGIFSAVTTVSGYYGGAHPSTGFTALNLDPATGEPVPLEKVLAGEEQRQRLPGLLFDHLETVVEGGYEFSEGERESVLVTLEDEVAGDRLTWTLTEKGFECRFGPDELLYYALGPMSALIPYEEEPELLAQAYRPENAGVLSLEGRLTETDAQPLRRALEELEPYYRPEPEPEIDPLAMRLTVAQQEAVTESGMPLGETGRTIPFARVNYPVVKLDEETAARWPALARALEELNEENRRQALSSLASLASEAREAWEAQLIDSTFYREKWLVAARADGKAFSVMCSEESSYGGQETFHRYAGITWRPETGERVRLAEVIAGPDRLAALPGIILDELVLLDGEGFPEEEKDAAKRLIAGMIREETLAWALGENGLEFGFAPYELTGKSGDLSFATLAYAAYPDLVAPEYLLPEGTDAMDYRTRDEWPETLVVSDEELPGLRTP